jgi:hypothetical protein
MSKVLQVYGMTVNEALRLSDGHVAFMLEHADEAARAIVAEDAGFQQALADKLAPIKRAVRGEGVEDPSAEVSTLPALSEPEVRPSRPPAAAKGRGDRAKGESQKSELSKDDSAASPSGKADSGKPDPAKGDAGAESGKDPAQRKPIGQPPSF